MKQRRGPVILHKFGTWSLKNIAALLNSAPSPLRDELRALFSRYRDSGPNGPNLQRMMAGDRKLERTLRDMWEVRCVFTQSGFADLELMPRGILVDGYDTHYKAIQIFGRLILNREWAKLDGPCSWCEKYFVRQRRSFRTKENVYCSRECSGAATATASMKAKHEAESAAKLEEALAAAPRWKPKGKISFRDFIHKETGFTKTWITQAIKAGKLRETQSL
jgi:hypothetical protein